MEIIDLSVPLNHDTVTWQNSELSINVKLAADFGADGSGCRLTQVQFGSHLATHMDAPLHFIPTGKTLELIPIDRLIGPCYVVDLTACPPGNVSAYFLTQSNIPDDARRIILKTSNTSRRLLSTNEFVQDFVGLSVDGAQWMLDRHVDLVGIDYISIGPSDVAINTAVHRRLLGAEVVLVEGLDLSKVDQGWYTLICLPLNIQGVEGSPVRAVLAKPGALDWAK
jgi:arylformamidase